MHRAGFSIGSSDKRVALVVLASILLFVTALPEVVLSQPDKADRQKVLHDVAQMWIQVGKEQYQRSFYKHAKQSLLNAQEYKKYLSVAERKRLNELLEKVQIAKVERKRVLEHIQIADELVKQNQLVSAKAHFEELQNSDFLTEQEQGIITEELESINQQLDERKREISELYDRSVELYRAGYLEQAREGFIKVVKSGSFARPVRETVEDYLVKIDNILVQRLALSQPVEVGATDKLPEAINKVLEIVDKPSEAAEPVTDKSDYVDEAKRKRNILRSYTKAVFNDAVTKAQNYLIQGEFEEAKKVVETAEQVVNKNRIYLKEELFERYSGGLKNLMEKIIQGQNR